MKACELDKIARDIITEYGYGKNFIHSTGHSLGLNIHENPNISKNDETILKKDMVITVEPGIYLKGEFGVRIEDTIHITNKGEVIGNLKKVI
jgi:Xaa-Pro dipeptidase